MKLKTWLWGIIEAVVWYGFLYYLLFAIKNPVELWQGALILLALVYAGTITCPWVRNTDAWRRMMGKDRER